MRKIFILLSLSITLILFLSACSTDFSSDIDKGMNEINDGINGAFEPIFKEDEKYSSNTDSENAASSESQKENDSSTETEKKEYTVGTSEGNKLPSYSVEIFDENGLTGELIDPSSLGKVTVINFWGTWCPPCVSELPEFDEVASQYGDQIAMVAIHSVKNFNTLAVSHVANNFPDSKIIFAKDVNLGEGDDFDECYEAFGGYGYYPHTIVLNKDGVIVYSEAGGLHGEDLAYLIDVALAN